MVNSGLPPLGGHMLHDLADLGRRAGITFLVLPDYGRIVVERWIAYAAGIEFHDFSELLGSIFPDTNAFLGVEGGGCCWDGFS